MASHRGPSTFTIGCFLLLVVVQLILIDYADACGGCGTSRAEDTACSTRVRKTKQTSYTCYTRTGWWFWRKTVRKTCYRTTAYYVYQKTCCAGYNLITSTTCGQCGRSKYTGISAAANSTVPMDGIHGLIVGGRNARPHQFPFQVRLSLYKPSTGKTYLCGGTIIAKRWILTAAHCVYGSLNSKSFIYVGDHDRLRTETNQKKMGFYRTYRHPKYTSNGRVVPYDIALIKTTADIVFNEDVQPACLPSSAKSYVGRTATISGWGSLNGGTRFPSILQYATAKVLGSSCRYNRRTYPNLLCAERTRVSACYGDSGGPMSISENGIVNVIGVSWFSIRGCTAGEDFGYTDVGPYLEWIRDTMY